MSSLFVAFCLAKNVTRNDNYITGTALYRINSNTNQFREITFKGFTRNPESLVTPFEKNSILLMVGYYVYEENIEYVTIIQSVPVSYSNDEYTLTSEDLLNSSPLLLYSASVVLNSYIPDNNGGRESFMLARRLYNGVTNNKQIDSKVIVSYINENNRYNALKNNLKKTVLSVVGRLKLESRRLLHVLASDIEWTYLTNDSQTSDTSSSGKVSSQGELDTQLESIEEKYVTLTSQFPQKKQRTNLQNSLSKLSNNKTTSPNFVEVVSQIQKETSSAGPSRIESTSQIINNESNSQVTNETFAPTTSCANKTNVSVNDNLLTESTHSDTSIIQSEKPKTNRKCLKTLLPAKK
ncbi:6691_t:CDS:2 [Scutellospora calospora]|uniref:6691_t:CDS:1 n=1 Tax=Scutellospora calospora TaxID=85575 RepID=A0ACA9LEH8_9GLOM|nr:6691_t:CDS:2 [Scutellospora calospora]